MTVLKFKRDHGLWEGFPYIDIENLQDHVFRPTSVSRNNVDRLQEFEPINDLGRKLKVLNSFPSMVPYMAPIENLYFAGKFIACSLLPDYFTNVRTDVLYTNSAVIY